MITGSPGRAGAEATDTLITTLAGVSMTATGSMPSPSTRSAAGPTSPPYQWTSNAPSATPMRSMSPDCASREPGDQGIDARPFTAKAKGHRMTHHIAAAPAGRPRATGLIRAMARKLSDRMHAAASAALVGRSATVKDVHRVAVVDEATFFADLHQSKAAAHARRRATSSERRPR